MDHSDVSSMVPLISMSILWGSVISIIKITIIIIITIIIFNAPNLPPPPPMT